MVWNTGLWERSEEEENVLDWHRLRRVGEMNACVAVTAKESLVQIVRLHGEVSYFRDAAL